MQPSSLFLIGKCKLLDSINIFTWNICYIVNSCFVIVTTESNICWNVTANNENNGTISEKGYTLKVLENSLRY